MKRGFTGETPFFYLAGPNKAMQYIAIALAPGLAICLYIFYSDIYNREPRFNLVASFLLGCLAILPAILLEIKFTPMVLDGSLAGVALFSYAVVGLSEECCKYLGLRYYSYPKKSFDEPLDGIVYSVMVGMGFATVENLMYVLKFAELGRGWEVGISRMFLSVPAHGTFAIIMGYYTGLAKFNPAKSVWLLGAGLFWAVFFHGTFDFFLFVHTYSYIGRTWSEVLLAGGAIASFIVSLIFSRRLIRRHKLLSQQIFSDKNIPHV